MVSMTPLEFEHSELLPAYPWGFTTPSTADDPPDSGTFTGSALQFSDPHGTALVASNRTPSSGVTGPGFWGPPRPAPVQK